MPQMNLCISATTNLDKLSQVYQLVHLRLPYNLQEIYMHTKFNRKLIIKAQVPHLLYKHSREHINKTYAKNAAKAFF
ncbi:hypothetical protein HMPREF3232_01173 [Fannyhessea vaginae]|nr:hypothetical protein HMPREF3232_01173 [Fannyhessea vaginae]